MGNVDVKNVVHATLHEADKNLPTEAATAIRPLVHKTYDRQTKIAAGQVSKILNHLGLGDDNIHIVLEPKFRRKFITRAGINAVEKFITENPHEALKAFGSRASLARYENKLASNKRTEE
jgi:hypothetical protein